MPPEALDFTRRAELSEFMDEPCSREVMRACLRDLARVNRWFLAYRPTLNWLSSLPLRSQPAPIRILDVGCGFGDSLRQIERWALRNNVSVELTGCDLNADTISIAAESTPAGSRIRWIASNIFALTPGEPIDIVLSSLLTHHLSEAEIIRFLCWMETTTQIGWFINDLSRASIPYMLFKAFAKAVKLHPFVQHDGPVSIARAFVEDDWRRMCAAAGLAQADISIQGFTPARLCVGRTKRGSR